MLHDSVSLPNELPGTLSEKSVKTIFKVVSWLGTACVKKVDWPNENDEELIAVAN